MMTDHIDTAAEREKLAGLAGFTPGPWFAGRDYEDGPFVAGGGYCLINTVGPELDREPNARLIAAAPDLRDMVATLADALEAERAKNQRLRDLALKAYTVVEWVAGDGFILEMPHEDADDLMLEMAKVLGVESSIEARAALRNTETHHDD